jgi:hypothetical protein
VAEFESDTAAEVTGLPSAGEGPETVGGAVRGPLVTGMRARAWADGRCTWPHTARPRSSSIRRWFPRPVAVMEPGLGFRREAGSKRQCLIAVCISTSTLNFYLICFKKTFA